MLLFELRYDLSYASKGLFAEVMKKTMNSTSPVLCILYNWDFFYVVAEFHIRKGGHKFDSIKDCL